MGLAIAGFAAIAIYRNPADDNRPALPQELADEPEAYLEDGVITQFRDDGSLHYRLGADRVTHFERDGRATLSKPTLELHVHDRQPWRLASTSGEVHTVTEEPSADEERVELRGNVTLAQDRADGAFTRVRTESLVVYPGQQRARSDQSVMIETDTVNVRAGGFEADLATGRMEFSSSTDQRVSFVVQPNQLNTAAP